MTDPEPQAATQVLSVLSAPAYFTDPRLQCLQTCRMVRISVQHGISLSIQWGGRQKNPDVLRSVMFWAKALAKDCSEIRIDAGADTILVSPLPATTTLGIGIAGDHIQVASLLNTAQAELDEVAAEIEFVEAESESPAEQEDKDDEA